MDYEPTEQLYWDLENEIEQCEHQLLFVLDLWHDRNENYARVAEAVRLAAQGLRKKSQAIRDDDDRRETMRKIGRILSVIAFHNDYAPYVQGSGGQRPGRPSQPIKSVTPGGLPGHGKRR